ncbi:MAG: ABC transporter permease [Caldilineaceae bacterium]|nr:ABC transporter permease [Caldilineaceae bacterium]
MTTSAAPESASSPYESGNLSDLLEAEGTIGESRTQFLTPRQLMLLRFKRNKLAVISFWFLALLYLSALFAPVISPYDKTHRFNKHLYLPPREIHIFSEDGGLKRPFVYAVKIETNKETFTRDFVEDRSQQYPVQFFVKGDPYKLWGLFRMDWHLFGVENAEEVGPIFLLGGDKFGRDILGRALYGGRISLTIGLVGVTISLIIGLLLGGLSGLYGGVVDNLIQRLIEFIRSIPTIPLWMGLAAALPADWPQIRIYFGITIILSLLAWTTLARVVRGKFLSLRNEDFVLAAQSAGANQWYLIWQHLVPSFMSYVLVDITLAIPGMIIGETALSFLGLGLVSPTVSWGVMLKDAQQVVEIAIHPWILWPAMFVVVTVLALNFIGDGLRDAADPYADL